MTEVNVADMVHITEVRAELEAHAAQLAAMRMDDERTVPRPRRCSKSSTGSTPRTRSP